jgi:hypothetical protein
VRTLRAASEDEVVDAFVRGELESPRFGERTRAALEEHGTPAAALAAMRGWRRDEWLFRGWPEDVTWWRVAMTPPEVRQILYINWDWWLTVTGGTRRPEDARVDAAWHEPIARAAASNAELIVVRRREGARIVCVEGHVRLTAYALFPQYLPRELELYLGESPEIARWGNY